MLCIISNQFSDYIVKHDSNSSVTVTVTVTVAGHKKLHQIISSFYMISILLKIVLNIVERHRLFHMPVDEFEWFFLYEDEIELYSTANFQTAQCCIEMRWNWTYEFECSRFEWKLTKLHARVHVLCMYVCMYVWTHILYVWMHVLCVCVCVCVCVYVCVVVVVCVCVCGLVRTYIRGQFCVFNHLTGDVRQVGTSPDVFTSPINFLSHFEYVWYIQCIFKTLSPYGR